MSNIATWDSLLSSKPICLYVGDIPDLDTYSEYIGVSIRNADERHILHNILDPIPLPDNSVDRIQSEDVFQLIALNQLPEVIDECFRVLKPGGLLRISVPDYRCDILRDRTEKSLLGKLCFDPMGGGTKEKPGHLWFPTIEKLRSLLGISLFADEGEIQWLQYYNTDNSPVLNPIDYAKGMITRTPDHDPRVQNPRRPMSIVVDAYKGFALANTPRQASPPPASAGSKSILFVNTVYVAFINHLYQTQTNLSQQSYQKQLEAINATRFGDADFYSSGMAQSGWSAWDVVVNCQPLQEAWCRENGLSSSQVNPLLEQIRKYKPDVVYFQDLALLTKEFHAQIRPLTKLIVGQIASPIPPQAHIHGFDIIISSFPHFVEEFRKQGICSFYQPLAFEPHILAQLGNRRIDHPFTFVGGISSAHGSGTSLLETVAAKTPLEIWGYGAQTLAAQSILRDRHHGEAWGIQMFQHLQRSRITLNRHIDVAANNANNMRLFEATGCGALLITDYKDNLSELFEIGKEVVAYRSPEECIELVRYYLAHPDEAETIAQNGQRRTLRDHTYAKRMATTSELLSRQLNYRDATKQLPKPDYQNISTAYTPLTSSNVSAELQSGWKDPKIPLRQRALAQEQLMQMYQGRQITPYHVLTEILRPIVRPHDSILEVGCSSGYYCEVLEYLLSTPIQYTGADYSEALIHMAKEYYPERNFDVADGGNLPYRNNEFHVAISGCVLLHVPDYPKHIQETIRVAKSYIVAHRTPVCRNRDTQYLKKNAYGIETVELIFNEREFIQCFYQNGAELVRLLEFHSDHVKDEYQVTYLFRKL